MADIELIMPKMGESIMEAKILHWLKKPGDKIEQDEYILEVATDKVDTEIPSAHAGVLKEILAKDGDVVTVGSTIAIIATEASVPVSSPTPAKAPAIQKPVTLSPATAAPSANGSNRPPINDYKSSSRFYSPLVKNIAKEENIAVAELESIEGSGAEGRVTKKDILEYVQHRKLGQTVSAVHQKAPSGAPLVPASASGDDEIITMDRMRKMIAERMIDSKRVSAHVTSFVEADVSNIVFWRNKVKSEFEKKVGEALTFTPIFIEAVVKAIRDFPMINIQVDGDRIIRKRDINVGMAVALPTGNLIVPVIRNADRLSLNGLAAAVNDLARRARENKLKPDDLAGGTYTISNVGSFGNVMGTPIIMQPRVAIVAVGAFQKKPAVVETPYGDALAIRHKMFLSHSYDHRVVDGALGGSFVRRVADYLEQFAIDRTF
jgi:2-oxoglutarate dehydrogenase E2 component (dihydrolipoamide succinyltransferase)